MVDSGTTKSIVSGIWSTVVLRDMSNLAHIRTLQSYH